MRAIGVAVGVLATARGEGLRWGGPCHGGFPSRHDGEGDVWKGARALDELDGA
ncbi:hypothetical protein D187_002378 [Cystobacter fuscus DSM 2262]|uniref:Uncharacterized protein n=1 Tax=Cystobacter fuscus (strain ATCC 25194 / DSM 2262 / NBRC 100088 / M29) TaxID=1242864 RepID=S9PDB5_CYSF2|nr:hypothetical protein D187_002378 [Cystobacter fuscus DSM 2262]